MVAQIKKNNSSELSPEEIITSSNAQINYHVAAQKYPGGFGKEWMLMVLHALTRLANSP